MDVEGNGFRNELSADDVAQTDANLRLASQFIEEFLNAPDEFEPIPRGSVVILLPPRTQTNTRCGR